MQKIVMRWLEQFGLEFTHMTSLVLVLTLIALTAVVIHLLLHRLLLSRLRRRGLQSENMWLKVLTQHNLFHRLALLFQGVIVNLQAVFWLHPGTDAGNALIIAAQLWILLYALLSLFPLLDILLDLSHQLAVATQLPLRGIFQGTKLLAAIIIGILMISLLMGQSPIFLISGLGAMAAVLMLVFKDPILGLVAGIQLSANDMLHLGDWLEMPKYGADGAVIDIGLTTVKVRNWDNTITTIPTYALVSDSFKNWRGMSESGGRRIKRSLNIDTTSIRFLSEADLTSLQRSALLQPYLHDKTLEIARYNQQVQSDLSSPLNGRRMTNLGTLRAYLQAYLTQHPRIRKDMTLMVRQLAPTPDGLPIEIYAFTNTVVWAEYEAIQADIFDHTFAVIEQFGLRIHQTPTGTDVRAIAHHLTAAPSRNLTAD